MADPEAALLAFITATENQGGVIVKGEDCWTGSLLAVPNFLMKPNSAARALFC